MATIGSNTPPKPVTPAEDIPVPPAAALDPLVAEPSILDKAVNIAKPYLAKVEASVEKAQAAAQPYADKAAAVAQPYADRAVAKVDEILDRFEGHPTTAVGSITPVTASSTPAGVPTSKSLADAPEVLSGTPSTASTTTLPASVGEAGEKAKVLLGQGLSAVQSAYTQITHTIDEKTASPTHPGIFTQVANAVHKGVENVEHFLNDAGESTAVGAPGTAATVIAVPVAASTVVGVSGDGSTAVAVPVTALDVPVLTTTNAMPHGL